MTRARAAASAVACLTVVVAGLLLYLPIVLLSGRFYTNQGSVLRSKEPARYRRWVIWFVLLFLASLAVLLGSYALSRAA